MEKIIEKAKELGELLQDNDKVKEFMQAKEVYQNDPEIQDLLGEFNLHQMTLMTVTKEENPDEDKVKELEERIKSVYNRIMENPIMMDFQKKSEAVEAILKDVNNIINFYVTGETPHDCGHDSCDSCGADCCGH
jgi:hypothetical protein